MSLSSSRHARFAEPPPPLLSLPRTIARVLLGLLLLRTGSAHLTTSRTEFQAQVPAWMPLDPDLVVVVSGLAEIALGGALIFLPRYRVTVGWIVAAFFVAVFPGNISQYTSGTDAFGLDSDRERLIRLFFQPLLVVWALWSTGAWAAWRVQRRASADRSASG